MTGSEAAAEADPDGEPRTAVLFTTHRFGDTVARRFHKLRRETPDRCVTHLGMDVSEADPAEVQAARAVGGERFWGFRAPEVTEVDYPEPWALDHRPELVPGNLGLLYLQFARRHPGFDRFWVVEYDVCYTGDWGELLERFGDSRADVLGTTLRPRRDRPGWHWWPSFEPPPEVSRDEWICGFFPVVRVSRRALEALDAAYRGGWSGHVEAVLPTAARRAGLEIEDLGGDGPFVKEENRDRFYTNTVDREHLYPGTFVFRPARRYPGLGRGKLWHPVKPTAGRLSSHLELAREWIRARLS